MNNSLSGILIVICFILIISIIVSLSTYLTSKVIEKRMKELRELYKDDKEYEEAVIRLYKEMNSNHPW